MLDVLGQVLPAGVGAPLPPFVEAVGQDPQLPASVAIAVAVHGRDRIPAGVTRLAVLAVEAVGEWGRVVVDVLGGFPATDRPPAVTGVDRRARCPGAGPAGRVVDSRFAVLAVEAVADWGRVVVLDVLGLVHGRRIGFRPG